MKKYYQMVIDLNNLKAMNSLAWYYCNREKDYIMMKKYYDILTIKFYICSHKTRFPEKSKNLFHFL